MLSAHVEYAVQELEFLVTAGVDDAEGAEDPRNAEQREGGEGGAQARPARPCIFYEHTHYNIRCFPFVFRLYGIAN